MSDIFRDYSFGGQLAHLRKEKKQTLRGICKDVGMDAGNYCKLEKSELPPPNSRATCISFFLRLKIDKEHWPWLISLAQSFHLGKVQERFTDNEA